MSPPYPGSSPVHSLAEAAAGTAVRCSRCRNVLRMRDAFDTDPVAVFADVIKNGDQAGLTKAAICKAVAQRGIPLEAAQKAYRIESLRKHPHLVLNGQRWVWSDEPATGKPNTPRAKGRKEDGGTEQVLGIHLRVLTDLAIDIEELVANEASAESVLERIHIRMKAQGLTPIGKIDERIAFDRLRHRAVAGSPVDGSTVYVVRPGYMWHSGGEEILVERALVSRQ